MRGTVSSHGPGPGCAAELHIHATASLHGRTRRGRLRHGYSAAREHGHQSKVFALLRDVPDRLTNHVWHLHA